MGTAVPWQRRCPCADHHVSRTSPCMFSHLDRADDKHQPEHNTASLVSALPTSCCIRDGSLLCPSFRRKHWLCLCFTRGRNHQYIWDGVWAQPAGQAPQQILGSPKNYVSFTLLPWARKKCWPTSSGVALDAWAAGTSGCLPEGPRAITDAYIRSSFCCLHHISKYINQHFLPAMTMKKKCINVHCLAGFHPVSVQNLSSKEDGPAVFSDLNPCKCFYSYSADGQQSFQKIPQNQPHSPCPQGSSVLPYWIKTPTYFCRGLRESSCLTLSLSLKARWQICLQGTARCPHPISLQE